MRGTPSLPAFAGTGPIPLPEREGMLKCQGATASLISRKVITGIEQLAGWELGTALVDAISGAWILIRLMSTHVVTKKLRKTDPIEIVQTRVYFKQGR